ncbi:hypothetical protein V8C86DRAFT_1165221 [Haematococcus lacustris]
MTRENTCPPPCAYVPVLRLPLSTRLLRLRVQLIEDIHKVHVGRCTVWMGTWTTQETRCRPSSACRLCSSAWRSSQGRYQLVTHRRMLSACRTAEPYTSTPSRIRVALLAAVHNAVLNPVVELGRAGKVLLICSPHSCRGPRTCFTDNTDHTDRSSLSQVLGRQWLALTAACRLPPAACRLPPAACRLPPAACRLPPAACRCIAGTSS